ncbi:MAG: META domain-containing protein [Hyphomonadaceae bacterium]
MIARLATLALVCALAACGQLAPPAQSPPELNGRWRVQQIAGGSLGAGVSIYFDIENGAVSGVTGCNAFTARTHAIGRSISFDTIEETQESCASAAAQTDETRFLRVLPSVRRFSRNGRMLELLPQEFGESLILLRREDEPSPG